jgi:putative ABC transport system substrate-binding protein
MNRRRLLATAVGALAAAPARAQQPARARRIGVLSSFAPSDRPRYAPMVEALAGRGYVEGRNLAIDYRFGDGDTALLARQAAELVRLPVDLIVAVATPAGHAAKDATTTVPVVFSTADPLASGLVTNLARPGGNLTGISTIAADLAGKQLELLREILPALRRVAFLGSTRDVNAANFRRQYDEAAGRLGLAVAPVMVADAAGFAAAFAAAAAAGCDAMVVQPIFVSSRAAIAALAMERRLPWIGDNGEFAEAGALLAFGADRAALWRRTGEQAARVLDGAAPGDMPVEQPTRFTLVVNQRAARGLGIVIPPAVLLRADEVIE